MISPVRSELIVTDNVPFGQTGSRRFFALTLQRPPWKKWMPGQFVMIRPQGWGQDILLPRPMSICRVTSQSLVLFFQVVGKGTELLARLNAGDTVTVWGPLGTGFAVEEHTPTLLMAGGIGIAPFAGYADVHPDPASLHMVFGHRLPANSYPTDALARRMDMENYRERGAEDLRQFQRVVRARMEEYRQRNGLALACGPMPFLRMVWLHARELGLRTQLSLEQRMACGIGACLGCVTVTSRHWPDAEKAGLPVQTCTSGPVFWASEVDLDADMSPSTVAPSAN